jgi:hypothetical protein
VDLISVISGADVADRPQVWIIDDFDPSLVDLHFVIVILLKDIPTAYFVLSSF